MNGASVIQYPSHCGHVKSFWETVRTYYDEAISGVSTVFFCGCGCQNVFDFPNYVQESPDFIFGGIGAQLFLPESLVRSYEKDWCMLVLYGFLLKWRENAACDRVDSSIAAEIYGTALSEVLLIDTGLYPEISNELEKFSEFTGLPARIFPAGTEDLRFRLESEYLRWTFNNERAELKRRVRESEKKAADYSMVADLTDKIIGTYDEDMIIHEVLDLFVLLFSPDEVYYIKYADGVPGRTVSISASEVFLDREDLDSVLGRIREYFHQVTVSL